MSFFFRNYLLVAWLHNVFQQDFHQRKHHKHTRHYHALLEQKQSFICSKMSLNTVLMFELGFNPTKSYS